MLNFLQKFFSKPLNLTLMVVTLVLLMFLPSVSSAQQLRCYPIEQAEKYLTEEHKETKHSVGLLQNGRGVYMLYLNKQNRNWTVIFRPVANPEVACLINSGFNWTEVGEEKSEPSH